MRYFIDTYGCQMNEYDSGLIASMMEENGCLPTEDPAEADFFFFNTCSIREKAEETAIARISKMTYYKKKRDGIKFIVTGCMAKHLGARLVERVRAIDFVIGPDNYKKIPEVLFSHPVPVIKRTLSKRIITDFNEEENYLGETAKISTPISSYITIQRGCNKHCSYCIVPYVRGPEKYRNPSDVIREVTLAAEKGVSEITLLGQTVNAYKSSDMDFADLLLKVSEVKGIHRVRFMSPHPKHYTEKLIDILLSIPQICPHAHIPLQSGSDRILKKMHRQHTLDEFMCILEKFRGKDPFYGLTTDIITGFVGEEKEDFEATLQAVKDAQFDAAFMFSYSPREGTESAKETEVLSEEEKQARLETLVELQNNITLERNKLMIGRTEEVLVERPSTKNSSEWVGKTGNFKKIIFSSNSAKPGDYILCHIDSVRGWTLRGTPTIK
ncbi:MAG: tRNA (N6-isopentenyl adenosine(37)-C2)-methylthiotransferase MiaB [Fibrobacteraceae bacterium]|nr:tRNA (N6-isopentenyl adenosine(37)-C2)-methylthiotransferase MiaB [Fibrobacteraceae bacterium]